MMDDEMGPIDLKYYFEDRDRHGNQRRYFRQRVPGTTKIRSIRLREKPGTSEFHEEFAAAMAGRPYVRKNAPPPAPPAPKVVEHSLRWVVEEYYRKSATFRGYDEETKKVRRRILAELCNEPVRDTDRREIGDLPCDIPEDKIVLLVDRKSMTTIDGANARGSRQFESFRSGPFPPRQN
jgi:hypothetical protein